MLLLVSGEDVGPPYYHEALRISSKRRWRVTSIASTKCSSSRGRRRVQSGQHHLENNSVLSSTTLDSTYKPQNFPQGWDCHGLPIEHIINVKLGVRTREDVFNLGATPNEGVKKYNEACREVVMTYAGEWKKTVERMGRWIDMENDYKTMDVSYMESTWWVFKQMFDKGMVYRGFKVMPYSTGCQTVLANFEAGSNYQDVVDPSVIVRFRRLDNPKCSLLAWTTTPWTLPSNLSACVHPEHTYLHVQLPEEEVIVGKDRFDWVLSEMKVGAFRLGAVGDEGGSARLPRLMRFSLS